jgi:hypothetical protein
MYITFMTSFAFNTPATEPRSSETHRFQLIILKQNAFSLRLGYDSGEALSKLLAVKLEDNLFSVGLNEIESYDWTSQSITLTHQATEDLCQSLLLNPGLDKDIFDLNAMKTSLGWGSKLERKLYLQAFVAVIDSLPTYGGIFLDAMSQMAIRFPVIRVGIVDGKAVFNLLPVQIPFLTCDTFPSDKANYDKAIAPEAESDWASFPEEIKMNIIKTGTTTQAQKLRQVIRNSVVRDIMEKAGKLKR